MRRKETKYFINRFWVPEERKGRERERKEKNNNKKIWDTIMEHS